MQLSIAKVARAGAGASADRVAAEPGGQVTYTISVRSLGSAAVAGALVVDDAPTLTAGGQTAFTALAAAGGTVGASDVRWTVDVGAGAMADVTLVATLNPAAFCGAASPLTIVNTACVQAAGATEACDTATVDVFDTTPPEVSCPATVVDARLEIRP